MDKCAIVDCDKPIKRKARCYGHYMKAWRYGTPTPTWPDRFEDLTGRRFGNLVVIRRQDGRWVCVCDCGAETVVRIGDLNRGTTTNCGDRAEHRRRDDIAYCGAHDRVRSDRGRVQDYECVGCGKPADHWSYDHNDPDERYQEGISARPVAYSVDPWHYSPRCVTCHRRFDVGHAYARRTA